MVARDWALLREHAQDVLVLDPENQDVRHFLAAAERALDALSGALFVGLRHDC